MVISLVIDNRAPPLLYMVAFAGEFFLHDAIGTPLSAVDPALLIIIQILLTLIVIVASAFGVDGVQVLPRDSETHVHEFGQLPLADRRSTQGLLRLLEGSLAVGDAVQFHCRVLHCGLVLAAAGMMAVYTN